MKILKIEFENINSLKGKHKIDFRNAPFKGSSLFAITGPTGSGKSTILDVISLALFNQVPRLGKISKKEILATGAILTRNQKKASAAVTYECSSGCYTSKWEIDTARTGNLKDYHMELENSSTGKLLDIKKSNIPTQNETLIGLNYNQFIKSVLLAQGEFAQFLRAKKDERGELLEKITGTSIYRKLGISAFQKKKEVTGEIELQQQEISMHRSNLMEEEELRVTKEELEEKTRKIEPVEKKVRSLEQGIQLKTEIRERTSLIQGHKDRREQAQKALEIFQKEYGTPLDHHEKLRLVREDLNSWQQLSSQCEELKTEITKHLEKTRLNGKSIESCLGEINSFIKGNATAEVVEEHLQLFAEKVRHLQMQRDEKGHSYKSIKREFETEIKVLPFRLNGNFEKAEEELKSIQDRATAKISELEPLLRDVDLEQLSSEKQELRRKLEKSKKAQEDALQLEKLASEQDQLQKERANLIPQLEQLPTQIALRQSQLQTLRERLEKLQVRSESEKLRRALEDHRHHLVNGQPCPLCGALEHPFAAELPEVQDGLGQKIKEVEKALEEKQNEVIKNETSLKHYQEHNDQLQEKAKKTSEVLQLRKEDFEENFGKKAVEEDWKAAYTFYNQQIDALEKYEEQKRKCMAVESGLPLLKSLKKVTEEGKELKQQLDLLYAGKNIHLDCQQLQKKWSDFINNKKLLQELGQELQSKLETRNSRLQEMERNLFPRVQKEGCQDISEALARLLPEQKAEELRRKKEQLCNESTKTEVAIKTLSAELQKLKDKDIEKTEEALLEELKLERQVLQDLRHSCEELRRKLTNHEEIQEKVVQIEAGLRKKKEKIRRWEILNVLIGDATGKKFNDFAQDLSLSQLLQLANLRLRSLSDRYKIDRPVEDEDDGLVAIDEHMGGQRRSVKTLSGGETFILSLSMALGLSDLASKNVEINSLFIDEGFGTLDPETLDQTLDTLEKLQAESSKTIGIISHVDSLKERIGIQVRLTRNGQGYSALTLKS